MNDLKKAKEILHTNNYSCVLVKNDVVYSSYAKGITPLTSWIAEGLNLKGFSAADKVIGRAAAMLFYLMGVKELYTAVISKGALDYLLSRNLSVTYDILVPLIENRDKTGPCIMDQAVANIEDPREAFMKLQNTIDFLKKHN